MQGRSLEVQQRSAYTASACRRQTSRETTAGRARCMMASLWRTTDGSIFRRVGWMEMMLRCAGKACYCMFCLHASSGLHPQRDASAHLDRCMLLCVWPDYRLCFLSVQQGACSYSLVFFYSLLSTLGCSLNVKTSCRATRWLWYSCLCILLLSE